MSPEKRRAWESYERLGVRLDVPSQVINAIVAALEEIEHMRHVVEAAKAVHDAISGEARAQAVKALLEAVATLRGSGR